MLRSSVMLALAAVILSGCGVRSPSKVASSAAIEASNETVASVPAAKVSLAASKPVDAYVFLGGRIKTCWFNPSDPLLPDHVYRADVSPNGNKVQITVHEARNLGRAGATTYVIDFKQEGRATVVTPQNRTMTPEQAAKMRYDIERWKRGETNCTKDMPQAAAAPAAR
ncbi:MAG: hypothetical protein ACOYB4_08435 [Methyloceanibacter sp.]